jgi:hypothetical protein
MVHDPMKKHVGRNQISYNSHFTDIVHGPRLLSVGRVPVTLLKSDHDASLYSQFSFRDRWMSINLRFCDCCKFMLLSVFVTVG